MGLKIVGDVEEVRHVIITGALGVLNVELTKLLKEGYEYLDSKVLSTVSDGGFGILYILYKPVKAKAKE